MSWSRIDNPRRFRQGKLAVAPPQAKAIGDGPCIHDGAIYPPPTEGRVLIDGIDARCWQHNPAECGATELDGGGLLQYLPNTTDATELDGGGVVGADDTLGATELDGGGVVELLNDLAGAGELDGGGEQRDERGATELDGGGVVELLNALAGAGELDGGGTVEPSETGATELDGGGVVELVSEDCGAGELDGGGATEGVDPGATCLTAGAGTLGSAISQVNRPNGEDWYSFPAVAGGAYHLDLVWPGGKGSVFAYYGTCAGLTAIGLHSSTGCYDYSGIPAGTTLYFKCLITYLFGTDYSFVVDAGTC